jgi:hypothetical protein
VALFKIERSDGSTIGFLWSPKTKARQYKKFQFGQWWVLTSTNSEDTMNGFDPQEI